MISSCRRTSWLCYERKNGVQAFVQPKSAFAILKKVPIYFAVDRRQAHS